MAVLALAAAGAATGAAIGGTFLGVTAASWGWMAGSMLGNALFGGTKSQGPRLGDLKFTGTEYGQPVPWVAGAPRVSGQVIWASTKRELAKTESVGKGGGSEYTTYTYEIDLLILLSENTTAGVARVWSNGELVKDAEKTRSGVWSDFITYTGAADQLPDPTYEAAVGLGNAPAYRGRTTVLIRGLQLGNSGQLPNLTFEVAKTGQPLAVDDYQDKGPHGFEVTNNYNDITGTIGFTGTFSSPAVFGRSGRFTGSYSLIRQGLQLVGGPNVLTIGTQNFTFRAWLRSAVADYNGQRARIFSNGTYDGYTLGLYIGSNQNGSITIGVRGAGLYLTSPVAAYPIGEWFHLVVQRSGRDLTGYVNGVQVVTGQLPLNFNLTNQDPWEIGGARAAQGNWNGWMDDVEFAFALRSASPTTSAIKPDNATAFYIPFNKLDGIVADTETLQSVVDQLMQRAGYQPDEWDSTDLAFETRPVRAMALAQVGTTRAALEVLASAYFFHATKGERIVFRRRASATPSAIAWDDLATATDATGSAEPFELNTGSDMEVPAQIALTYPNMAGDYNPATEHSARLLGAQDSTQAVQLGLGLLPAEAKLVADALLFDQVTGMVTASISLPPAYSHLQPADVLLVPDGRGRTHRMRVDRRTDSALVAALDLVQDDPAALTSEAVTDVGYALSDSVRQLATTWWQALDIPLLRDGDNAPGYYVAMAPDKAAATDIWRGAVFVRSWSAEQYETAATTDQAATLGSTTAALPAWDGRNVMDESATLLVRVSGQLAGSTREAMQADLSINVLALGSEVLRFRGAELLGTTDGENDYRLTGLLRAQLGTEWAAAAAHPSGTRVVLLSGALRRITDQPSQVGTPCTVKAVSQGLLLGSVTAQDFTNTAVCLRPLAPVHLRAARAGGDLSITWQRRTRLGYRYGGAVGVSVPLGEEAEAYRVDVYQGATLLRSISTTTPAATYTAADQAADGLTTGAAITLQVLQRSAAVGDGYATTLNTTTP